MGNSPLLYRCAWEESLPLKELQKNERSIFLMHSVSTLLTAAEFHLDFINEGTAPQML